MLKIRAFNYKTFMLLYRRPLTVGSRLLLQTQLNKAESQMAAN